ncbi:MAG TPA: VIT domain-containing protein [Planctomycetota bacterium]|nr:VIT domain-containing protein [Planctomycetota bacterium]
MSNTEAGGLFSQGNRVPLKGVQIDVTAAGAAANVTVAQRYKNTERIPVEAVYSFPLQESCAVSGFEIEIGGKKIIGKIEEREKAFEKYDEAMAQGHGAFLVDQDRPNIFTASVGNLLPDQEAVIRLSYATELEQNSDSIRLLIPTTISPRYISKEELKKMDPAELDHIAPPTVLGGVPYGLKLSVEMDAAADVREVSCPSHPASVSIDGRKIRVELAGQDIQLDQDFVLNVRLAKPHEASAVVAREGDGARAVMVNLFPDLKSFKRGPCEFVFIIDRSGSMQGQSIARARAALLLALRSLEEGDKFNIVGFGSSYDAMFKESVVYSQKTLDEATKKVEALHADMGGTELLAPLTFVLGSKDSGEMPRQAILLTDGQVGNEAACIALASESAARCRVFTFGIGSGVSEFLVKGLARASGGQAEFIHDNERIEPKVLRQFARMSSAFLKNARVDWGAFKTDFVAPSSTPQLFDGDRLTLYARVIGGTSGEVAVVADGPNGTLRFPVIVDLERALDNRAIPVLMARRAIQELEEGGGVAGGSAQADRKVKSTKAKVLELALRYQIMSSETSFVAVEERAAHAQSTNAELRRIPIALTKGWGNEGSITHVGGAVPGTALYASVACAMAPSARVSEALPSHTPMSRVRAAVSAKKSGGGLLSRAMDAIFPAAPPPPLSAPMAQAYLEDEAQMPEQAHDALLDLAKAQRADGSFDLNDLVMAGTRIPVEKLHKAADALACEKMLARRIVATLVALNIFAEKFADRSDEWKMLADKAERWLAKQKIAGVADLKAWADKALST